MTSAFQSADVGADLGLRGMLEKDFVSWGSYLRGMANMELRHLRYFIAVAEEGSLTVAAEHRLHTAQPSLSRQMRDLEIEVGAQLMTRSVRGIVLTAAGRVFLDHVRLALAQVEAAGQAARRAAEPDRTFALGFLSGHELEWLPEALRILRDKLPEIDVTISSKYSPELADALTRGKLDVAFLRPEDHTPDLVYKRLIKEPLVVVLPSDHRLAAYDAISPRDLVGEIFIGISDTAPALRAVIHDYIQRSDVHLSPAHEVDYLSMAISLVASTRGVALLPIYAQKFLPVAVVSRPIRGAVPTIDLALGYHKANTSTLLRLFLARADEMIARVSGRFGELSLPQAVAD